MPQATGDHAPVPAPRPTVLIVEDHRPSSLGLEAVLKGAGCVVSTAATLAGALAMLQDDPDIAILDLSLPDGNGLEVLREVRSAGRRARVVVIAGTSDPAVLNPALALRPDLVLARPIDVDRLLEALGLTS
jgi:DNA-binding NarL/FixJ family response regulator